MRWLCSTYEWSYVILETLRKEIQPIRRSRVSEKLVLWILAQLAQYGIQWQALANTVMGRQLR
jgi:hypothetical protein